jgi:hypothetical protein
MDSSSKDKTEQESDSVYSEKEKELHEDEHSTDESKTTLSASRNNHKIDKNLENKETKWVRLTKTVVLTFMVVACTTCATIMYLSMSRAETENFQKTVSDY